MRYPLLIAIFVFGLGSAAQVDNLEVRWPDGWIDRRRGVPADQVLEVVEGQP